MGEDLRHVEEGHTGGAQVGPGRDHLGIDATDPALRRRALVDGDRPLAIAHRFRVREVLVRLQEMEVAGAVGSRQSRELQAALSPHGDDLCDELLASARRERRGDRPALGPRRFLDDRPLERGDPPGQTAVPEPPEETCRGAPPQRRTIEGPRPARSPLAQVASLSHHRLAPAIRSVLDAQSPEPGKEGGDVARHVLRRPQRRLVEAVEIDDEVEAEAEREEIGDGQELLRLLEAPHRDAADVDPLARRAGQRREPVEEGRGAAELLEGLGHRSAADEDDEVLRPRRMRNRAAVEVEAQGAEGIVRRVHIAGRHLAHEADVGVENLAQTPERPRHPVGGLGGRRLRFLADLLLDPDGEPLGGERRRHPPAILDDPQADEARDLEGGRDPGEPGEPEGRSPHGSRLGSVQWPDSRAGLEPE